MKLIRDYTEDQFHRKALEIFRYQVEHVPVFGKFAGALGTDVKAVRAIEDIPFLPVEFFKYHRITDSGKEPEIVFELSGTTGMERSRHFVADAGLYRESFMKGFEWFYGAANDWCFLALLPSYLEREGSSLVYMAEHLIRASGHTDSGFYLYDHDKLLSTLRRLQAQKQKTILLGVSFALTDLAEACRENFSGILFMETGGMKGRKKELVREEVHQLLTRSFGVATIHSEYGMTELLSQAYSQGKGLFRTPPWMKVLIRDTHDPFNYLPPGSTGLISIVDLANYHSCAFISTSDLGRSNPDGTFEVLGRMDNSDVRGCNLLIA